MLKQLFLGLAQFANLVLSSLLLRQQRADDLADYQQKRLDAQADALQQYIARHNLDLQLEGVKQINRLAEATHKADIDLEYLAEQTADALELAEAKDHIGDENAAPELRDAIALDVAKTNNDIFSALGGWPGISKEIMDTVDDIMYLDARFFKQPSEDYPLLPGDLPERNLEPYGGSIKDWMESYGKAVDPIFAIQLDKHGVPDEVRPTFWAELRTGPNETININGNDAEVAPIDAGSGIPKKPSGVAIKGFPGILGAGMGVAAEMSRWLPSGQDTQPVAARSDVSRAGEPANYRDDPDDFLDFLHRPIFPGFAERKEERRAAEEGHDPIVDDFPWEVPPGIGSDVSIPRPDDTGER